MTLKEYAKKRTTGLTFEPEPIRKRADAGGHLVFVVQKHESRRLHYDLRLEMEGVLKSFAVPKGPSLDPSVKRLAVMVEDHPFDYKDFEGVIPEGNYGAGTVSIWDKGFYGHPRATNKAEAERMLCEGLEKGDLKFVLAGKKLRGEFALIKTRWDKKSWLLLKKKDAYASKVPLLGEERSVSSARSGEKIADGKQKKSSRAGDSKSIVNEYLGDAPRRAMPHGIKPMLCAAAQKAFIHPDWLFEVKWDGYRAIAEVNKKNVSLYSRNRLPLMRRFPLVARSLQKLGFPAVLDGEIIVEDKNGVPDFQRLQHYKGGAEVHSIYYVFDLLFYNNRDLTGLPLVNRKAILREILPHDESVRYSDHVWKDGVSFFRAVKQKGIEGIVAKHSRSPYRPGYRSELWLKVKNRLTQDCVIAGFTRPRGSRKYIGSLVLGAYRKGTLVYVGHSGGSLGNESIAAMYEKLRPLARKTCPFKKRPPEDSPVTWVKPIIVCEVGFTGWTEDSVIRHPVFIRLREDKEADEARYEKPVEFTDKQEQGA